MEILEKLLPPILLGVGLIIPLVLKSNPFKIKKNLKALGTVIFLLTSWVAYFLTVGFAYTWHYNVLITIVPSLLATLLFFYVFITAWKNAGELNNPVYLAYFGIGIFFLSLSSGNWVAQNGKVLVTITSNTPIKEIKAIINEGEPYSVYNDENNENVVVLIFKKDKFSHITSFKINGTPKEVEHLEPIHSGFPAKRYKLNIYIP